MSTLQAVNDGINPHWDGSFRFMPAPEVSAKDLPDLRLFSSQSNYEEFLRWMDGENK